MKSCPSIELPASQLGSAAFELVLADVSASRREQLAFGVLTSAVLVPENGPPQWTRPMTIDAGPEPATPLPTVVDWLGASPVDGSAVEMPLAESLRNPWGILHGGAVAALVDLAAEHVAGGATTDVVLHFLAPNRVGPVRATAVAVGSGRPRADGTVLRVEVRDEGADRVTALAVATSRS